MFVPIFRSKKTKNRGKKEQLAAIKIQAHWRGKKQHQIFKRVKVEKATRGYYTHTIVETEAPIDAEVEKKAGDIETIKKSIYMLLEDPSSSKPAKFLQMFILGTIVFSIACFVLETAPELRHISSLVWWGLECFCTVTFSLEFALRMFTCDVTGMTRMTFLGTPMNVADLFAIMPFYVELCVGNSAGNTSVLRVLRAVRLVRLFRIFKLGRHSKGMQVMAEALRNSMDALWVLIFFLAIGCILFSSLLYYLEKARCPNLETMSRKDLDEYADHCSGEYSSFYRGVSPKHGLCCTADGSPEDFPSIISALWWSIVTMTTVGFGDTYPRTTAGKFVGFVAMLVGMILIAVPVAIVGNKFQEVYENSGDEEATQRSRKLMKDRQNNLMPEPKWKLMARTITGEHEDVIGNPIDGLQNLIPIISDPALAESARTITAIIGSSWSQRGQLRRERHRTATKQQLMTEKFDAFVDGIQKTWSSTSRSSTDLGTGAAPPLPPPEAQK